MLSHCDFAAADLITTSKRAIDPTVMLFRIRVAGGRIRGNERLHRAVECQDQCMGRAVMVCGYDSSAISRRRDRAARGQSLAHCIGSARGQLIAVHDRPPEKRGRSLNLQLLGKYL